MTVSIVARCPETGMFGVAVSSSSPAVAARCAHARAGVGAVASQNVTDPSLGPRALDLMSLGAGAEQAVAVLRASAPHMEFRQVLAVDGRGGTAMHSGPRALGIFAEARGESVACGGNLLSGPHVPQRMVEAFEASSGHLGDRLVAVMRAAVAAGGEAGPLRSAGLTLVDRVSWPVADLRVDWTEDCPVEALAALWALYKPQLADYVTRALDPGAAPSYGVPGDE
ncbi:DUF1028 domain-containing protein [Methylobacterium terricola]|uniref:DUF1028 domain-containing protein n=1 Tax=Methylobacterium terricola TaxID=2583531 RepID=A0A5C4L7C3_9HYPH|nr:DUF1028 domain-containing protein [Methylobacterium terricola]TNC04917.1 DUF1028 domain-containing protein [Methylobacterium terricola]